MTQIDAIIEAHRQSKSNGYGYAYAIERPACDDWIVESRKPSIRHGKTIECRDDGTEVLA